MASFISSTTTVTVTVVPTGQSQGPFRGGPSLCKTADGWNICVVGGGSTAEFDSAVPGGVGGILQGIVSLGLDPADWNPAFVG
jgi:hypothetical protein